MKHRLLFFAVMLVALSVPQNAQAYDFSAVAPSGQRLYFDINGGHAELVNIISQNHTYNLYMNSIWVSGNLIIPDTVYYNNYPLAVTVIQSVAFRNQHTLLSVVIPNTVTQIGIDAFNGCTGMITLTLPSSITTIDNSAFYDFSGACSVIYTGSVAQWCNINFSNLYSNPVYSTHRLIIGGVDVEELVIPTGVTQIKQYAFYNCTGLKSLSLPSTLTTIGTEAFRGCYKLQPVTVPSSVISIGSNAFYDVPMIFGANNTYGARCRNGYVENGLYYTSSGKTYFVGASPYLDSITIPNAVSSIVSKALYGYDHLKYLSVPSTVRTIGASAFQDVPMVYYYGNASGRPWGARAINAYEENGLYYTSSTKDTVVYADANLTSAVLPNTVTTVNDYAFVNCHNLTSLTLGSSLTTLGDHAFAGTAIDTLYYNALFFSGFTTNAKKYGLDSVRVVIFSNPIILWPEYLTRGNQRLTYVDIGNAATTISDNMFNGCTSLVSINIPNSVTSIGGGAFYGCSSLGSITLPNSLTSINGNTLYGCTSITSLTIPDAVTTIGYAAFADCHNLSVVTIGRGITDISRDAFARCYGLDTIYFNADSMADIPNTYSRPGIDSVRVVIMGDSVRRIPRLLFKGLPKLTYIKIGSLIDTIPGDAFNGCSSLNTVVLPDSARFIDGGAFAHCTSLSTIEIPNTVYYMGASVFDGCTGLTHIGLPSSIRHIRYNSFYGCTSLASVDIPNSVDTIGYGAFNGCASLVSVTLPNSMKIIENSAFRNCTSLHSIVLPDSLSELGTIVAGCTGLTTITFGRSLSTIHASAFDWCTSLDTLYYNADSIEDFDFYSRLLGLDSLRVVIMGDSVRHIPSFMFYNMPRLNYLKIGGAVRQIYENAIHGCPNLSTIIIPNSVTTIGYNAFANCSGLASVSIPNSTTSIGNNAFNNCTGLTTVTLGRGLTSISTSAFSGCINLDTLYFNADSLPSPSWSSRPLFMDSIRVVIMGDSVRHIPENFFESSDNLGNVTVGGMVRTITHYAFQSCPNLALVEIPNSVTNIDSYAFNNCSSLQAINIPNSVTSIGHAAFSGCSSLQSINIPNSVTSIGGYAFNGCTSLSSINIPNSVSTLNWSVFSGCTSLDSIVIPNSVTSIDDDAFYGCTSLSSIVIPYSVTSIGDDAFRGCTSLVSAVLPASITAIQSNTFRGCSSLATIEIPDSVTNIMNNAFDGCTSLRKVYIGHNVTTMHYTAFSGCTGLDTLYYNARNISNFSMFYPPVGLGSLKLAIFGDTVFRIPSYLFMNATDSLTTVVIGSNVAYIESGAFQGCNNISSLWMMSPNPPSRWISADTIHILCGALPAYQSIWGIGWNYQQHLCDLAVISGDGHGTANVAAALSWDSTIVINASNWYGYHFDHWSNVEQTFYSTTNPDTIHFDYGDTIKAYFERNAYSITVTTMDSTMGQAFGNDTVLYEDMATIYATPNYGYHFTHWSDGNYLTSNPRTLHIYNDTSITALFDYNRYLVDIYPSDFTQGNWPLVINNDAVNDTVAGGGYYDYNTHLTILARPNYGYHFTMWSDGDTNNPRSFTLTQDTFLVAYFERNQYTITAVPNDSSLGTVTGGGTYLYGDVAVLTATCTAEHYHCKGWRDTLSTDGWIYESNTIPINVVRDCYMEAIFEHDWQWISFYDALHESSWLIGGMVHGWCDDLDGGTNEFGVSFQYGSTVTLEAIAADGFHFGEWGNGNRDAIESFELTGDTTICLSFAPDVYPEICMVSVQDNRNMLIWDKDPYAPLASYNIFREGETSGDYELAAVVPYDSMSVWVDEDSRPMSRSYRYKISATDIYDIESDESPVHKTMHLTINKGQGNNWNLIWTPYEGIQYSSYQIYRGSDLNNLELIHTMSSNGNTTYTDNDNDIPAPYYQVAIIKDEPCEPFKSSNIIRSNIATDNSIGIDGVYINGISIRSLDGQIVLDGADGKVVAVYDIIGRPVVGKTKADGGRIALDVPSAGVYVVKIDGLPAQKVVVVK